MKKAGVFVASIAAAASSVALPPEPQTFPLPCSVPDQGFPPESGKEKRETASKEKFAPRFDGLRFIETLVTAHR